MQFLENAKYDWMDMLNFHERPFRASFVPAKVWKDLDKYRNDSKGLSNYFRKWRTKIEWRKNPKESPYVWVGGEYDPETRQCQLNIYTKNYDKFKFTDSTWDRFKFKLIQTEMHELIHFMQYDRRYDEYSGYILPYRKVGHAKKNEEREYLSHFDEIQAYAHCVLLEFKCFKPNIPIETLISRAKHRRDSRCLHYILRTFNFDYKRNEAIPKLMSHILKWDRKYQKTIRASKRA